MGTQLPKAKTTNGAGDYTHWKRERFWKVPVVEWTKPVVGLAVVIITEDGRASLHDSAYRRFSLAFADPQGVIIGRSGECHDALQIDAPRLARPSREETDRIYGDRIQLPDALARYVYVPGILHMDVLPVSGFCRFWQSVEQHTPLTLVMPRSGTSSVEVHVETVPPVTDDELQGVLTSLVKHYGAERVAVALDQAQEKVG